MNSRKAGDPDRYPHRMTVSLDAMNARQGDRGALRLSPQGESVVLRAIQRNAKVRNVRARTALLKDRVRELGQAQLDAMRPPAPKGYTWRGWWYPRWLVLGPLWSIVAGLFVALVVGSFRLFGGAA